MSDERIEPEREYGWVEFPPGWGEYQEARDRWLAAVRGASTYSAAVSEPRPEDERLAVAR